MTAPHLLAWVIVVFLVLSTLYSVYRALTVKRPPDVSEDVVQMALVIEGYERRVADLVGQLAAKDQPVVDPVALYRAIEALPSRVLQTINGSLNPQQGKVAELLAYASLRMDYDQIVPLGKPVDFIGFKYSTVDSEARIDFVEVKSGNSQLTPDEKFVKQIVDHKSVAFRLVRVTDEAKKLLGGEVE